MRIRAWRVWVAATSAAMAIGVAVAQEPVGVRPYELDWAGRVAETPAPLVDFEEQAAWRVETVGSEARFERTREQQIWGRYVGKLTYRGTEPGANEVRIVPPQPIPVREAFDALTLWVYGNNWGYAVDPSTPQVTVSALFRTAGGLPVSVFLYSVDWTEWNLLHRRLSADERRALGPGCTFVGFSVKGGRQKDDRSIYLDNLCLSTEGFAPLTFEPRPQRGIAMFPGQGAGTNNGPGKLPFPTRAETILPPVADKAIRRSTAREGAGVRFTFTDRTGVVEYRYAPRTGLWDDLTATFTAPGGKPVAFRPCVGGGAWLRVGGQAVQPTAKLARAGLAGGRFEAIWDVEAQGVRTRVAYRLQAMGKSLVIDTEARGGAVAEVRYGRAVGAPQPRLVTHPFYPADGGRPATLVMGTAQRPLFLTGNVDWYRTNASTMWAANTVDKQGALYNGGTRYTPLTNGKANDCFERFFLTLLGGDPPSPSPLGPGLLRDDAGLRPPRAPPGPPGRSRGGPALGPPAARAPRRARRLSRRPRSPAARDRRRLARARRPDRGPGFELRRPRGPGRLRPQGREDGPRGKGRDESDAGDAARRLAAAAGRGRARGEGGRRRRGRRRRHLAVSSTAPARRRGPGGARRAQVDHARVLGEESCGARGRGRGRERGRAGEGAGRRRREEEREEEEARMNMRMKL